MWQPHRTLRVKQNMIQQEIVYLPAILSWFRRDFGGKKKIIRLLKQKNILQANADPKISFKKYDWSIYLNNYKN